MFVKVHKFEIERKYIIVRRKESSEEKEEMDYISEMNVAFVTRMCN